MKVLMVGLGGIGQRHLRNLRRLVGSGLEVLAVRKRKEQTVLTGTLGVEGGSSLDEKYALRVFDDLEDALKEGPEAVFVCNPTSLHVPTALAAAKAGCHLFIEKPLSHDTKGVAELIKTVADKKLAAFVGYQLRCHPCVKRLGELLAQRAVGRVLSVQAEVAEHLPSWHTYEDYRRMYASRKDQGGGVILSQIHEFDYLYSLFGMPKRVFAVGGQISALEIDVEDNAGVLMEYRLDGRSVPVHVHMDYNQRPPSRWCKVVGDDGSVRIDFHASTVSAYDAQGIKTVDEDYKGFDRNELFVEELSHFLACCRGERSPGVSVSDGLRSLEIALAAKESLESGRIVEVS